MHFEFERFLNKRFQIPVLYSKKTLTSPKFQDTFAIFLTCLVWSQSILLSHFSFHWQHFFYIYMIIDKMYHWTAIEHFIPSGYKLVVSQNINIFVFTVIHTTSQEGHNYLFIWKTCMHGYG